MIKQPQLYQHLDCNIPLDSYQMLLWSTKQVRLSGLPRSSTPIGARTHNLCITSPAFSRETTRTPIPNRAGKEVVSIAT